MITDNVEIFDTTLRDGAQQQGVNFSVSDKLKIAQMLSDFGFKYIEGGWPGAIPKDTEFFKTSPVDLIAFGATRKPNVTCASDEQIQGLLESDAKTVCLVAKSDIRHVEKALRTTASENLAMVIDSIKYFKDLGREVIIDAEHFFDGFDYDKDYAISVVKAAFDAGARVVVLCDTNGGHVPTGVYNTVTGLRKSLDASNILGIHAHNDTGCAVANSLAAYEAGVRHIQGTINEYGERTGNANILTIIANLQLKYGVKTAQDLTGLYNLAHEIAEIANVNINQRQPYVGDIAFAHKAGLHASAIKVDSDLYQHINPAEVGNDLKMIVSEMAGRSSIELKAQEFGFDLKQQPEVLTNLTNRVKELEQQGYAFDLADASFNLLLLEVLGKKPDFFQVESWRTISESQGTRNATTCAPRDATRDANRDTTRDATRNAPHGAIRGVTDCPDALSEATVKLHANGTRIVQTGEGNGPVNALDQALRFALRDTFPRINDFELTDYRVRLLDTSHGTDSITRVLITCYDSKGNRSWSTIGVGGNIVEASWEALTDTYIYGLL